MITTRMETVKGETIEIRQAREEEQELAKIYNLLDISHHPMGTRKFVGPPFRLKKAIAENQSVALDKPAMWVNGDYLSGGRGFATLHKIWNTEGTGKCIIFASRYNL